MKRSQIHAFLLGWNEHQRAEVKKGLSEHTIFKVVGESDQWNEALQLLGQHSPDVIFGNPEMKIYPDLGWIDAIPRTIAVVLIATHPRLACAAFEKRVLDYVLLPLTSSRLKLTVARLLDWKARLSKLPRQPRVTDKRVLIQNRKESLLIRAQTIICVRAEGNYTHVIMQDGTRKLVHRSLRAWKKMLPSSLFFQIHRSTLINLEQINQMESGAKGGRLIRLNGHEEPVLVSRRMAALLKVRLKYVT